MVKSRAMITWPQACDSYDSRAGARHIEQWDGSLVQKSAYPLHGRGLDRIICENDDFSDIGQVHLASPRQAGAGADTQP
jgi:hypothetical protein